jgi:hypothetical protein
MHWSASFVVQTLWRTGIQILLRQFATNTGQHLICYAAGSALMELQDCRADVHECGHECGHEYGVVGYPAHDGRILSLLLIFLLIVHPMRHSAIAHVMGSLCHTLVSLDACVLYSNSDKPYTLESGAE